MVGHEDAPRVDAHGQVIGIGADRDHAQHRAGVRVEHMHGIAGAGGEEAPSLLVNRYRVDTRAIGEEGGLHKGAGHSIQNVYRVGSICHEDISSVRI